MKLALLLSLVALSACRDVTGPTGTPFTPPPIYRVWWAELEACSGLTGDFDGVRFYVVSSLTQNGVAAAGGYSKRNNAIVLVEKYLNRTETVQHEMMHALLRGIPGHPPQYFNGACGILNRSAAGAPPQRPETVPGGETEQRP